MVAGLEITEERLDRHVAEVTRGPRGRHVPPQGGDASLQFRRWLVQELVTRELLIHEARAAGLLGVSDPRQGMVSPWTPMPPRSQRRSWSSSSSS